MKLANLLVELQVEELPPKALKKLGESFAATLFERLQAQGLTTPDTQARGFASPRRLGLLLSAVRSQAAEQAQSQKLMPVSVGLDAQGQPSAALLKKLQALGADATTVAGLRQAPDGKAPALFYDRVVPGVYLAEGLQLALNEALARLPIPKLMGYQLHQGCALPGWSTVHFVRPAHSLVALHGEHVVAVQALGLTAGRSTVGHRFEASAPVLHISEADAYEHTLRTQGAVIPNFDQRSRDMVHQLQQAARSLGLRLALPAAALDDAHQEAALMQDELVQEVTALVERPKVLVCSFDAAFLAVPQECLILTMKANQKYFPLTDAQGRLANRFLVVSNIQPADASAIIEGNERVVRPRLADAQFFYDQDRKKPLESRVPQLAKVVYHNKLGTQGERVERVRALARAIGQQLGGDVLAKKADTAAKLAKADLLTDMVGEFPELQGIMGGYYARHDGLGEDIADAIEDHYKPRFAGDELPRNEVGLVVALADKLETLVGMFGIGNLPTGDKDPFALRRHALGVIRMLVEKDLPVNALRLIQLACSGTAIWPDGWRQTVGLGQSPFVPVSDAVESFFYDRLAGSLRDQGYSAQEVDAVLALKPQRLGEVPKRLAAARAFAALPEAAALAAANKRIGNILKKAQEVDAHVSEALLKEPVEQALYAALKATVPAANAQFEAGDYTDSLQTLAALRAPVDAFFEGVMVNADALDLRLNRQGLLKMLHQAMNRVADLSRLAT